MSFKHAIVWIDHQHATVIDFSIDDQHLVKLDSSSRQRKLHRKSGPMGSGHAPDDAEFFEAVVVALGTSIEIVVVGPGTAKTAFVKHVQHKHAQVAKRIVGTETLDHPSDRELLTFARKYFRRVDSLLGNP
jgi:stalled ribosome rescue protein Dom34